MRNKFINLFTEFKNKVRYTDFLSVARSYQYMIYCLIIKPSETISIRTVRRHLSVLEFKIFYAMYNLIILLLCISSGLKSVSGTNLQKKDCAVDLDFTNAGLHNIGPNFIENPFVERLVLKKNGIQNVSYGAFDGLPSLQTLDLSYNNLTLNNLFSFGPHSGLKTIILDNNFIISDQKLATMDIRYTYDELRYLSLRNVKMDTISTNISAYVPSLTHLDISENRINTGSVFPALPPTVTHLYLEKIEIVKMIETHTTTLKNLKYLSLSGNIFNTITNGWCTYDKYLCLNLVDLQGLSLVDCQISSITTTAFVHLTNLRSLNISSNSFTTIPDGALSSIPNLNELDVSNNLLNIIPNFRVLKNLTSLIMNDMKNTTLVVEILKTSWDLPKLKIISLNGNRITNLPTEMIRNLTSLEELHLSSNRIKHLPIYLGITLTHLRQLYLRENLITDFDHLSLNGTKSLELLDIEGNDISSIKISSIQHLPYDLEIIYGTMCFDKNKLLS